MRDAEWQEKKVLGGIQLNDEDVDVNDKDIDLARKLAVYGGKADGPPPLALRSRISALGLRG